MEARYVHTPAVAPEHRAEEPGEAPVAREDAGAPALLERVEAQVRTHPGYFMAGGFAVGVLFGILLRR